jgi:hypothetical protein
LQQRRHGKVVLGGEPGGDKAGVDQVHLQAVLVQFGMQQFGQIDQRRLAGP